ncbi:MAG: HEPN domain-containing protein, partial [Bacteroidales bacterium]
MDDKVKYWQDLSDYDMETAVAMLKSRRYLYVGFMCHQAIEKIFLTSSPFECKMQIYKYIQ